MGSTARNESQTSPSRTHCKAVSEKERGNLCELAAEEGDVRAQRQLQARGELLYAQISAGEDSLLQVKLCDMCRDVLC
jgi:hypothetical protein